MKTVECTDHRLYTVYSTGQGHRQRIEVSLSYLFHFCFSFYNHFLLCVSCCFLACVFGSVLFFRFTDKLLSFDFVSIYFNFKVVVMFVILLVFLIVCVGF